MIIQKKEILEEVNVDESINDLFRNNIVKSEVKEILEKLFEQEVDKTMTEIFFNNKGKITKEEFKIIYNDCKSEGLFITMMMLNFKF